ncbi:deoxyribonuclease NucA/NucB-domain-containing protein [Armillaria mellea]|nr:deoxyribonuclease NucA/NucB-domain-containing protein [Armillaria mellea]
MLNKVSIILNACLLAAYALPTDPPSNLNASWPEGIKSVRQVAHVLEINYTIYPESAENICYAWHCMNAPRRVAPNRGAATADRRLNSCGSSPNRCSPRFTPPHARGYQCDEWPWANSNAGGRHVATRCIPARDNGGSGSVWGNFANGHGPQAQAFLNDRTDFAEIRVTNIPRNAHFCLAELPGHTLNQNDCNTLDINQPYLQRSG